MITYKDAGVDVERGYEAVRRMKQHVAATFDENVLGGLGSAVCECVAGSGLPVPVVRHGVQDVFGRSGAARDVLAAYGLTADGIRESVKRALALKG